jgi:hypothetical protein
LRAANRRAAEKIVGGVGAGIALVYAGTCGTQALNARSPDNANFKADDMEIAAMLARSVDLIWHSETELFSVEV